MSRSEFFGVKLRPCNVIQFIYRFIKPLPCFIISYLLEGTTLAQPCQRAPNWKSRSMCSRFVSINLWASTALGITVGVKWSSDEVRSWKSFGMNVADLCGCGSGSPAGAWGWTSCHSRYIHKASLRCGCACDPSVCSRHGSSSRRTRTRTGGHLSCRETKIKLFIWTHF